MVWIVTGAVIMIAVAVLLYLVFERKGSKPPVDGSMKMLSMVALKEAALPRASLLVDYLTTEWRDTPEITDIAEQNDTITFQVGGHFASIALEPTPIPWSQLEGPCAAAWHWSKAVETLRKHAAHCIVYLQMPEVTSPEAPAACLLLTRLTAAVTATSRALGVYWESGKLVIHPQMFLEHSRKMTREELPLYLWIDFHCELLSDGSYNAATTGLGAFGYPELEVMNSFLSPDKIRGILFNIAHYIIDHGITFPDGGAIPMSSGEKIFAHLTQSVINGKRPVVQLEL